MLCNARIVLYLSSLNYEKKEFKCACFKTTQNTFNDMGNQLRSVSKIYIPLTEMKYEKILINPNVDYAIIDSDGIVPNADVSPNGELLNASILLKSGANLITLASLKNYGSLNAQHYYLEVTK